MSYGISGCFRPLSRNERQVAHALLTRPPLSQRKLWPKSPSSVLRSTWMCYARRQRSSWARIKLSKILYMKQLLRFRLIRSSAALAFQLGLTRDLPTSLFFAAWYLIPELTWCLALLLNLPFVRVQKNCRDFVIVSIFHSALPCLTSLYFLHLLLFNFQGPSRVSLNGRLDYYTTTLPFCQYLF